MKYKKIPKEYFVTVLDRLTRFEPAYIRYKRVFDDIINKFFISSSLKTLTLADEISIVEEIFNSSVERCEYTPKLNQIFTKLEERYFNFNEASYQYLSSRLNISQMIKEIKINENTPQNVLWLKKINEAEDSLETLREEHSLLYPIERLVLCEGQTEYVLLETIFSLFGVDFKKLGVSVIPAGGKNQVARKYYKMLEYTKIPFFILLDKDAKPVEELIASKLRDIDTIYLIKSGEFEDLIPKIILQKTINHVHKYEFNCNFDDFDNSFSTVENLEKIYKKYGFGDFKKAQFALELKKYIKEYLSDKDFAGSEIFSIIDEFRGVKI